MDITITPGTVDLIAISGAIDMKTVPKALEIIQKHIQSRRSNIVIDLNNVTFMSSAGFRAVLAIAKETRGAGGDLRISSPKPSVDKVLRMVGIHNIVKIFATVEEAVKSFEK